MPKVEHESSPKSHYKFPSKPDSCCLIVQYLTACLSFVSFTRLLSDYFHLQSLVTLCRSVISFIHYHHVIVMLKKQTNKQPKTQKGKKSERITENK